MSTLRRSLALLASTALVAGLGFTLGPAPWTQQLPCPTAAGGCAPRV